MSRPAVDLSESTPQPFLGADGNWHVYIPMVRRADGTTHRKHLRRKTRKELVREQRRLEEQRDRGEYVSSSQDVTLRWWTTHWLEDLLPLAGRKPKTIDGYRSTMELHVLPALGDRRLSTLRVTDIAQLLGDMKRSGKGEPTINATHAALRASLAVAVQHERLRANPAKQVHVAKAVETTVVPLSLGDVLAILSYAQTLRNGVRWSMALSQGLRQGECLGLQWADIDFEDETVTISRALRRETGRHGCRHNADGPTCGYKQGARCPQSRQGGLVARTPKNNRSRTVPMPPGLSAQLKAHRAAQVHERLKAGRHWRDEGWVFATPLGAPIDPRRDWDEWKSVLAAAGVRDARVHDARHTAATLLLASGVDTRTLMDLLGWSEQRTAQRYAHVIDPMRREAVRRMGGLLFGQAENL